jgi:hypothetical protein
MKPQGRLLLSVYAPVLADDDGRPLAAVHAMERALPGMKLDWEVSKEGRLIALQHRDARLADAARRGQFLFLCNGDERAPMTISGLRRPASTRPGGQPQLQVHADLTLDEPHLGLATAVLAGVADGLRAFWGHVSPEHFGLELAEQLIRSANGSARSPRGLPILKSPDEIAPPEIPYYLGWLNYWSAAAARAIGFPDPDRDVEWLSRSRRTATGGWIVQLTDAPLDLDNPAHLDALLKAYERFPVIGGRSTP